MTLNPSQFCSCNWVHHGGMTGQLCEFEQQTTIFKKINHYQTKSLGLFRLGMPPGMQHKQKPSELGSCLRLGTQQPCSQVHPGAGSKLGHTARQDLLHITRPGAAGWECSCSVPHVFQTGCFTANKTCKVFREFGALGRMMHNHPMPRADQLQCWSRSSSGCAQHGAQTNKASWKLKNCAQRLSRSHISSGNTCIESNLLTLIRHMLAVQSTISIHCSSLHLPDSFKHCYARETELGTFCFVSLLFQSPEVTQKSWPGTKCTQSPGCASQGCPGEHPSPPWSPPHHTLLRFTLLLLEVFRELQRIKAESPFFRLQEFGSKVKYCYF